MSTEKWKEFFSDAEMVPGMREQGKGIKIYGECEYAPLKAAVVGSPTGFFIPDPKTPEGAQMFKYMPKESLKFLGENAGKNLKDVDPKLWDVMAKESNALADAYRQAGVHVIRHEGELPDELRDYSEGWSGLRQITLWPGSLGEVLGNIFVRVWEVSYSSATELLHREAIVEAFKNTPDAVWLETPSIYPNIRLPELGSNYPGPFTSPGDFRIFPKHLVLGIGVADPSHINDVTKQRSSGDEFGAEVLRRMLEPFGWKVSTVYFDSRLTYHIDCLMPVLEEGLLAYPKGALWTELPEPFNGWEVIDLDREDQAIGAGNCLAIGNKRLVVVEGTKFAKTLEKRGWTCIEVPYKTLYTLFGSGIHCSTASLWREFD